MIRLKLFGLMIAFALLALVRPRKVLEMLEAADNWVEGKRRRALRAAIHRNGPVEGPDVIGPIGACQVPPAGWRCTRAAGHSGPCAAVETHTMPGPL